MTLKELIEELGGDYEDVFERLVFEESIERFLKSFLTDETFYNMIESLKSYSFEQAFYYAHTLKGLSRTLGFFGLYVSSGQIAEGIRSNLFVDNDLLMDFMHDSETEYAKVIDEIEKYFAFKQNN